MKKRNIGLVTNSSSGGWSNFNELSYTDLISSLKSDYFFFRVFDPMSNGHSAEYREILKTWQGENSWVYRLWLGFNFSFSALLLIVLDIINSPKIGCVQKKARIAVLAFFVYI